MKRYNIPVQHQFWRNRNTATRHKSTYLAKAGKGMRKQQNGLIEAPRF